MIITNPRPCSQRSEALQHFLLHWLMVLSILETLVLWLMTLLGLGVILLAQHCWGDSCLPTHWPGWYPDLHVIGAAPLQAIQPHRGHLQHGDHLPGAPGSLHLSTQSKRLIKFNKAKKGVDRLSEVKNDDSDNLYIVCVSINNSTLSSINKLTPYFPQRLHSQWRNNKLYDAVQSKDHVRIITYV